MNLTSAIVHPVRNIFSLTPMTQRVTTKHESPLRHSGVRRNPEEYPGYRLSPV